jgi:hypothetical protein
MTRDEFDAWRDSYATKWFMTAIAEAANAGEAAAKGLAWSAAQRGALPEATEMAALAMRAAAYRDVATAGYDKIAAFYEEPNDDE